MPRRIEIVKNNGNMKSRVTITPERVTVKLRDEDLNREDEIVSLCQRMALQIPEDEVALRGTFSNFTSNAIKLNSGHIAVSYIFKRDTGELVRIRRSGSNGKSISI